MRRKVTRLLPLLLFMAPSAQAADEGRDGGFTVVFENDFFLGKDSGYTSGLGLSWAHTGFTEFNKGNTPGWLHYLSRDLYISTMPDKQRAVSYTIAQVIQTPGDITTAVPIDNEAPYVGQVLWAANLHAFDDRVADRVSMTLGWVGPLSGAEQTQKWAHKVFSSDEPRGWDNQLGNEPVFRVSVERLLRLAEFRTDKAFDMDVIGSGNAAAGTIESYLAVGLGTRLGRGLDRSFPTANFVPGRQVSLLAGSNTVGWNVFANVQVKLIANDITIDGNTFKPGPSVPLKHWQAAASAGLAYGYKRWAFLFSTVIGTDRYEGQPNMTRFGSLSVTYNY